MFAGASPRRHRERPHSYGLCPHCARHRRLLIGKLRNKPDPAGRAPADPLVGWAKDPLPIPHPLGAFGVSFSALRPSERAAPRLSAPSPPPCVPPPLFLNAANSFFLATRLMLYFHMLEDRQLKRLDPPRPLLVVTGTCRFVACILCCYNGNSHLIIASFVQTCVMSTYKTPLRHFTGQFRLHQIVSHRRRL